MRGRVRVMAAVLAVQLLFIVAPSAFAVTTLI
jgi:hypothetical protein